MWFVGWLGCGGVCEPWAEWDLPGIESVSTCYPYGVSGKTSASEADFDALFAARGFRPGYVPGGENWSSEPPTWTVYTKEGSELAYKRYTTFRFGEFLLEEVHGSAGWLPRDEYDALAAVPAARDAFAAKVAPIAARLTEGTAPERCDDAVVAAQPGSAGGPAALETYKGGWLGWLGPIAPASDTVLSRIGLRSALDHVSGATVLLVVTFTELQAPVVTGPETFTPGHAAFVAGVVELSTGRVLCRAAGSASSSLSVRSDQLESDFSDRVLDAEADVFARLSPKIALPRVPR